MSNQLCLVLSVILTTTMLLAACAPVAAPAEPMTALTATSAPVQPTIALATTAAPVPPAGTMQPTTAPSEIPQSGDLCGGTGGRGQIVSVGNNEFTIKRNDDGSDQIIHLTSQATIKTSAGSASLSDLKIGYRVTLVGGSNPDGSFTAGTVIVCNGTVP
jgi:pectate lyase